MSTQNTPVRSRRSRLLALVTTMLVAFSGLVVMPTAANAAEGDVTNANLDWGFKESWRLHAPTVEFIGSANYTPGSTASYRWGSMTAATFAADTGIGSFGFEGGVKWTASPAPGVSYSITVSNFAVNLNLAAGSGEIWATHYIGTTGEPGMDAHLANFSFAPTTASDGVVNISGAAATAASGTPAIFGTGYPVGTALDPVSFSFNYEEAAAPAVETTTTLAADAASVEVGQPVNLTATVAPAADGWVEFFNGSTSLGAPVAVASGVASFPATLAAGTHNLRAEFSPADAAAFVASASNTVEISVTVPQTGAATSVDVAAAPAAPVLLGDDVTLTATVTNDDDGAVVPVGTVEFFSIADGTTDRVSLGSDNTDAGGIATIETDALTAGGHGFVAVFTPSVSADFQSSEGVHASNYGVIDTAAPTAYVPGSHAETASGATASWNWSAYSSGWVKTATGNASVNGQTFELTGGEVLADTNGAVISFEATLTNSAYGGVAIMSVTDPALHLKADGTGVWVANVNGSADRIVVGTFSGVDAKVAEDAVRTVTFDYADTTASGTWYAGRTSAWPNAFILQMPGSVQSFYYHTTDSAAQANKPASPLAVDFEWPAVTELSLSATPEAPVALGTEVTFEASVVPPAAEGEVEFFATSAVTGTEISLGTAGVETSGVATLKTTALVAGGHAIRAVYTSSNGFNTSEAFLETVGRGGAVSLTNYGVVDTAQVTVCTPAEGDAETLNGVTASWGWSAYSEGWEKFAGGNVSLDGENFVLSNGVATVTDDCASIAFTGTLRTEAYQGFFPTHGQWVELVNPVLTIDAAGNGAWTAGVRTGASELNTETSAPTVIAAVTGATFPDFAENSVSASIDLAYADTTAKGTWSAGETSAWGNAFVLQVPSSIRSFYYASGAGGDVNKPASAIQLDWTLAGVTGTVNGQSNDVRVLQGQSVTFEAGPFRAGDVVSVIVNSDPVVLPSVTVGNNGLASRAWTVPANFETGAHTVTFTAGTGADARTGSISFTVEAVGSNAGGGGTPDVCIARAVTGGTLNWEFKQSFKTYISGPIAGGTFTGGSFAASGGAVNVDAGGIGRVNFQGTISATGHHGSLNLLIQNPSVQITGPNSGVLYGTLTESGSGGYIAIATLSFSSVSASASALNVTGSSATLTGAAAAAFGGFYGAGTALDPVSFSVSLGGEVACDSSTDPVELAKTGGESDTLLPLITGGAIMLLLGLGLLRMRRQRVA